ncbi:hypothetical protein WG66_008732 [Moniliophthora roreri]|nr:hypothetical protein WG66_008732 [Moniliophthora roreri]
MSRMATWLLPSTRCGCPSMKLPPFAIEDFVTDGNYLFDASFGNEIQIPEHRDFRTDIISCPAQEIKASLSKSHNRGVHGI